jgi:ABC-type multidrug transport system fused ATPase/permease subunit
MTSVERAFEYVSLPSENKPDAKLKEKGAKKFLQPPKDWPQSGEITFENVSFSYDKNLPNVLNSLSFKINAGEKIGIVGE